MSAQDNRVIVYQTLNNVILYIYDIIWGKRLDFGLDKQQTNEGTGKCIYKTLIDEKIIIFYL